MQQQQQVLGELYMWVLYGRAKPYFRATQSFVTAAASSTVSSTAAVAAAAAAAAARVVVEAAAAATFNAKTNVCSSRLLGGRRLTIIFWQTGRLREEVGTSGLL